MSFTRFCIATLMIFPLFATPALAQGKRSGGKRDIPDAQTVEKRAKDAQVEKDYKAALDKIPDQKANADPWGNVRSVEPTKAKATIH
jgi:hypothetical protein